MPQVFIKSRSELVKGSHKSPYVTLSNPLNAGYSENSKSKARRHSAGQCVNGALAGEKGSKLSGALADASKSHRPPRKLRGQTVNRFLNTKLRTILNRYLKERKQIFTESQALFLSQLQQRIATRQIQRRLDQWVAKAGIDKRITPHSLRHSFATGLYARTSNILVVQQALGHASVSTTEIYAHLFDETLEDALETL